MMTVKIDKYSLFESETSFSDYVIVDNSTECNEIIITISTGSIKKNRLLGQEILKELNTGKYEGDYYD